MKMKFGLHMILANQSIAQLSRGLQIALGNAQTIISFRISRSDPEVLARVLGKVDPSSIKHHSQTDIQHPVYAPLQEQWEGFIQQLTNQKVRQFTVKTADDRLASIWSLNIKSKAIAYTTLDKTIRILFNAQGNNFQATIAKLLKKKKISSSQPLFTS